MYAVMEMCGNFSHTLEEFDTREEAEHFMIESAGNDVTTEYGNEIVEDDIEYMSLLENALSYYNIEEWIGC